MSEPIINTDNVLLQNTLKSNTVNGLLNFVGLSGLKVQVWSDPKHNAFWFLSNFTLEHETAKKITVQKLK